MNTQGTNRLLSGPERDTPDRSVINWAVAAHASGFLLYFLYGLHLLIPLFIMLTEGKKNGFVNHQALQALVFQSIMLLLLSIGGILTLVLAGFLIVPVVAVIHLVLTTIATINSSKGERYCYPLLEGLGTDETS
ncbi:MAG: DUF4870 domain-containing protein [Deltaproteobacteria bacterium]|nr:DUF4870 domain-containing protein [Candidatus Zymogenaceae bacterium]